MHRPLTALVATTLLAAVAVAQPPLTLSEALSLAASQHETPRIAQARMAQAQAVRREALALLFPSLTLVGTYKRAPEVIVETGGAERLIQRENALNAQAVVEARLLDLSAFTTYDSIKSRQQAVRLEAQDLSRRFAFEVAEAFFTALAAQELTHAAELRRQLAEGALTDARARFTAGLADRSQPTRAELELATAEVALANARGTEETALAALTALVGRPVSKLAPPGPVVMDRVEPTGERLEQRPDVQSADLFEEAARTATRAPWLRLVPTLGVRAVASTTNETGFVGTTNWNVAATLTWALYDGGLRYAQAAARSAELEEAAAGADLVRRNAALEVQVANARLSAALAAAKATENQASLARRNAEETGARYRAGFATALEQADASSAAFLADSEVARQRFTLHTAQLDLLRALGQWPESPPPPARGAR